MVFCFPLPGETRYGRLRPPSRLKMNSLCSALTAVLASQTIQLSGKRETKHHELAQITVKILDSNRPSHGSPKHSSSMGYEHFARLLPANVRFLSGLPCDEGGLRADPATRPRRASLHLPCSKAAAFGLHSYLLLRPSWHTLARHSSQAQQ
jgi:hypothetical protein